MRNCLVNNLINLAQLDKNIYLIVGDLGFSVVEPFKEKFPERFFNAGISEQSMIGISAGLALAGKKVFVYSIIPFITSRCFEQIRVDLCYQNLPVRLIGVGAGVSYGHFGVTHQATEDIAIMRALPNMTVISPASNLELNSLVEQVNKLPGPAYFRLYKNSDFNSYLQNTKIILGKALEVIKSDENLIVVTGDMIKEAFEICNQLRAFGIDIGLTSMHTIKPFDFEYFFNKKSKLKSIFTIEEHSIIGGLADSLSAFILKEFNSKIIFDSFSLSDNYFHQIGSPQYLKNQAGLSVENIKNKILDKLLLKNKFIFEREFEVRD